MAAAYAPENPERSAGRPVPRRSWRTVLAWPLRAGDGIWLEPAGPVPGAVRGGRVVDLSVTRAGGDEDFVTAVFAELDPAGWLQLVNCGHPPPLRLSTDRELRPLAPAAFAAPLGLHPDLHPSTFSVRTGERLLFFTDGLLEARDRAGRFFRVDQQIQALSRPDLQTAVDELLDRLRAHTRRTLDDDVAVLLAELTLTAPSPGFQAAVPGQWFAADVTSAVSQ